MRSMIVKPLQSNRFAAAAGLKVIFIKALSKLKVYIHSMIVAPFRSAF